MSNRIPTALIAAVAVTAIGGAIANADIETNPYAATASVALAPQLKAGDLSPFDVAGVKAIRRGKAIPDGYVLQGYSVTLRHGVIAAGAEFFAVCPKGKTLRSFAETGRARALTTDNYLRKPRTLVQSFYGNGGGPGIAEGVIYAVCR